MGDRKVVPTKEGKGKKATITYKDFSNAQLCINTEIVDLQGRPIVLNDLGVALTIIHESIHAAYTVNPPDSKMGGNEFQEFLMSPNAQHNHMAHDQTLFSLMVVSIRAFANNNGIQLATSPIDEAELICWNGLLNPRDHRTLAYVSKYAKAIEVDCNIDITNGVTKENASDLNFYVKKIQDHIYRLVSKLK